MNRTNFIFSAMLTIAAVTGCDHHTAQSMHAQPLQKSQATEPAPFKVTAGIKDIMAFLVDPAADALWESVSIEQTPQGEVDHQPHTNQEWRMVRGHAVRLMESANLLVMDGRKVAMAGHELEDQGTPGNLTAAESQAAIDDDHATFVSFAQALHDVGEQMLSATESQDPQRLMELGDSLDQVCEGCHLRFWYPGQNVPRFPDQAPEVDAPLSK